MKLFDFLRFGLLKSVFGKARPAALDRRVIHERLPISAPETIGIPQFDDALSFWFANRQGDAPPDWSSFRPEKHPTLLPHIILYEKIEDRFFTRIVGDALQSFYPESPMGKFLDETCPPDRLPDVMMRLSRALSDGLPNYVEKQRLWQERSQNFGYNALSMPFGAEGGRAARVLCILQVRSSAKKQ